MKKIPALPIVFLPGIGVTCKELESQKQYLEKKGIRVICLDWPAFDKKDFNFSHHADWVVGKLKDMNIKKAGFFGQSRGGLALIKLAAKYPETVAFAVVNSAPAGCGPKSISPTFYKVINLLWFIPSGILKFFIRLASRISKNPWIPFLIDNEPKELVGCYLDHMNQDWTQDVESIKSPAIFRYGENDTWVKRAGNQAVTQSKKNVVYHPSSGHAAPDPEELWKLINECAKIT